MNFVPLFCQKHYQFCRNYTGATDSRVASNSNFFHFALSFSLFCLSLFFLLIFTYFFSLLILLFLIYTCAYDYRVSRNSNFYHSALYFSLCCLTLSLHLRSSCSNPRIIISAVARLVASGIRCTSHKRINALTSGSCGCAVNGS